MGWSQLEAPSLSPPNSAVQRRPIDSEGTRVRERSRRHEEARTTPLGKRTAAAERNEPIYSLPFFKNISNAGMVAIRTTIPTSPKSEVQRRPADSEGTRVRERSRRYEEARTTPLGKRTAVAERNEPIYPLPFHKISVMLGWTRPETLSPPLQPKTKRAPIKGLSPPSVQLPLPIQHSGQLHHGMNITILPQRERITEEHR